MSEYNAECVRQSHRERIKTMHDYLHAKKSKPEESIYQIGDRDDHVSATVLWDCYCDYYNAMNQWNREHGYPMKILDIALHDDEATPHIHQRRVWQYHDDNGLLRVGQENALKEAGIELPDPLKPEGRYNNRKMTFDALMRDKWLDICEAHGLDIERDPLPDGRHHKDKEDYIRDKVDELIDYHDDLIDKISQMKEGAIDIAHELINQQEYERGARER